MTFRFWYLLSINAVFVVSLLPVGLLLPITFNNKYSSGGLIIILMIMNTFNKPILIRKIHIYIFLYILVNIIAFFISAVKFDMNLNILKMLISVIILFWSPFVLQRAFSNSNYTLSDALIPLSVSCIGFAMLVLIMIGGIYVTAGSLDPYVLRAELYKTLAESGLDSASSSTGIFYNIFYLYGGTASIGPLASVTSIFFFFLMLFEKKLAHKFIYSTAFILSFGVMLLCVSRASILSFIVVITFYFIISRNRSNYGNFFIKICITCFITIIAVLNIDVVLYALEKMLVYVFYGGFLHEPRIDLWWNATVHFVYNPFGYGFEYVRLLNADLSRQSYELDFHHSHLHNFYITNLIEFGIIGAVLYAVIVLQCIRYCKSLLCSNVSDTEKKIISACLAALIGSVLHLLFATQILRLDLIYGSFVMLIKSMILYIYYKNLGVRL